MRSSPGLCHGRRTGDLKLGLISPHHEDFYREALAEGFERPGARRTPEEFQVAATVPLIVAIRMGCEAEVETIQGLYLDGKKDEAAVAVPTQLVGQLALIGSADKIRDDPAAWCESPVTTLLVGGDPATLRTAAELVLG